MIGNDTRGATSQRLRASTLATLLGGAMVVGGATSIPSISLDPFLSPVMGDHVQVQVPVPELDLHAYLPEDVDPDAVDAAQFVEAVAAVLSQLGDGVICSTVYWFALQAPGSVGQLVQGAADVQPESYLDIVAAAVAASNAQRDEVIGSMSDRFGEHEAAIRRAAAAGSTGFCRGVPPAHIPADRLRMRVDTPAETLRGAAGTIRPVSVELPEEVPVTPVTPPPPPAEPGDDDSVSPARI